MLLLIIFAIGELAVIWIWGAQGIVIKSILTILYGAS